MSRYKRYAITSPLNSGYVETPAVDAFLEAVAELEKKHGLSLSHEDSGGSFEVVKYKGRNEWLLAATDATDATDAAEEDA